MWVPFKIQLFINNNYDLQQKINFTLFKFVVGALVSVNHNTSRHWIKVIFLKIIIYLSYISITYL